LKARVLVLPVIFSFPVSSSKELKVTL